MWNCHRILVFFSLVVFIESFLTTSTEGSETMDTAMQFSKGQIRAVLYHSEFRKKPVLQVESGNEITIKFDSTEFKYFSSGEQSINCDASGNNNVLKLVFYPLDGLYWWTKIGLTNYALEIASMNVTQKFDCSSPGMLVGIGAKYQVFPETIVTPGICLDFGITISEYKLDKFHPSVTEKAVVDYRLEEIEYQAAFLISKLISIPVSTRGSLKRELKIEPYGGFKFSKYYIRLTEQTELDYADGSKYNLSGFIGSRIKLYPMEWIICELSFLDETALSIGFGWGF